MNNLFPEDFFNFTSEAPARDHHLNISTQLDCSLLHDSSVLSEAKKNKSLQLRKRTSAKKQIIINPLHSHFDTPHLSATESKRDHCYKSELRASAHSQTRLKPIVIR